MFSTFCPDPNIFCAILSEIVLCLWSVKLDEGPGVASLPVDHVAFWHRVFSGTAGQLCNPVFSELPLKFESL